MSTGEQADPVRATFVAILQQLNRAESQYEGKTLEQSLYLDDLQRSLRRFWTIDEERVKLPQALGLLVRNGLVVAEIPSVGPARDRPAGRARYRITPQGKQFLVEALEKTDRIL